VSNKRAEASATQRKEEEKEEEEGIEGKKVAEDC
jgi:hypothetical protein